jgi:hypothetical protein
MSQCSKMTLKVVTVPTFPETMARGASLSHAKCVIGLDRTVEQQ